MEAEEIAYQDIKQEQDSKKEREVKESKARGRICICAGEAVMTVVNSQWQMMPDFKPFQEQFKNIA